MRAHLYTAVYRYIRPLPPPAPCSVSRRDGRGVRGIRGGGGYPPPLLLRGTAVLIPQPQPRPQTRSALPRGKELSTAVGRYVPSVNHRPQVTVRSPHQMRRRSGGCRVTRCYAPAVRGMSGPLYKRYLAPSRARATYPPRKPGGGLAHEGCCAIIGFNVKCRPLVLPPPPL